MAGRGVTAGDEVSAFLILTADTPVKGITVRLRLPPGMTYGGGGKGIAFDDKTGLITWTELETDRQSAFEPFTLKLNPALAGALVSLRPEASSGPGYVIAGEASSLEVSPRQRIERVGPRGGTLSAPGGRTQIEFPPDSRAAGMTFTLTEVAADGAGADAYLGRLRGPDWGVGAGVDGGVHGHGQQPDDRVLDRAGGRV